MGIIPIAICQKKKLSPGFRMSRKAATPSPPPNVNLFSCVSLGCDDDAREEGMQGREIKRGEEKEQRGRDGKGEKEVKKWEVWHKERDERGRSSQWGRRGMGRGRAGGRAERSLCSDTALCVAMVQAQSELHSSFAAQLANYPQTAMLIRRRPKPFGFPRAFFDCCTDTQVQIKGWFIYVSEFGKKMYLKWCRRSIKWDAKMCCRYVENSIIEHCSGALLCQPCHLCNIKSSPSAELHCP